MNLIDMHARSDKNFVPYLPLKPTILTFQDKKYRGFNLNSRAEPIFEIKNFFKWFPYSHGEIATGWKFFSLGDRPDSITLKLEILEADERVIVRKIAALKKMDLPFDIMVPELPSNTSTENLKLRLSLSGKAGLFKLRSARVFLAVHQSLDRGELFRECRGKGVELGPGHNPQIKPSKETIVEYIEQMSPADWNSLYNKEGKYNADPVLWQHYKIGEAHAIPAPDSSLDFIFSSHVFEHLANPIAHLMHWHSKLKSGGKIIAIVPDVGGCKDYVFDPSRLDEILEEATDGEIQPGIKHYSRWAKFRAPGQDPETFLRAKRSIHCHFYTKSNMAELLEFATKELGFSKYDLRHCSNHKDFHFILTK